MMGKTALMTVLVGTLFAGVATAQEHWTEGPVWGCAMYRTQPGQYDNYMKYLRETMVPQSAERKKQGTVLDTKMFVRSPPSKDAWDVMLCSLYASYAKALDFDAEADKKDDSIREAQFKTADRAKQDAATAPRLVMREYLGTSYDREVTLRPLK